MDNKKASFPFPAMLLITALVAGGIFKYYAPLDSMRPLHGEREYAHQLGEEKVLSRMWQDPFQAVANQIEHLKSSIKHPEISRSFKVKIDSKGDGISNTKSKGHEEETNSATADSIVAINGDVSLKETALDKVNEVVTGLKKESDEFSVKLSEAETNRPDILPFEPKESIKDKNILILPVLTTAGTYAENIEKRLRSRYAILSALHVAGYKSDNSSHLGVFERRINDKVRFIPYEWFVSDPLKIDEYQSKRINKVEYDRVLILWLGDEYFYGKRLVELKKLVDHVRQRLEGSGINNPYDIEASVDINKDDSQSKDDFNNKKVVSTLTPNTNVQKKGLNRCKVEFLGPSNSVVFEEIFHDAKNVNLEHGASKKELNEKKLKKNREQMIEDDLEEDLIGLEIKRSQAQENSTAVTKILVDAKERIKQKTSDLGRYNDIVADLVDEIKRLDINLSEAQENSTTATKALVDAKGRIKQKTSDLGRNNDIVADLVDEIKRLDINLSEAQENSTTATKALVDAKERIKQKTSELDKNNDIVVELVNEIKSLDIKLFEAQENSTTATKALADAKEEIKQKASDLDNNRHIVTYFRKIFNGSNDNLSEAQENSTTATKALVDAKGRIKQKTSDLGRNNDIVADLVDEIKRLDINLSEVQENSTTATKTLADAKEEIKQKTSDLDNNRDIVADLANKLENLDIKLSEVQKNSLSVTKAVNAANEKVNRKNFELNKKKDVILDLENKLTKLNKIVNDKTSLHMYSPWATAAPFLLMFELDEEKSNNFSVSVSDMIVKMDKLDLDRNSTKFITDSVDASIRRSIHTDMKLTEELVDELGRRGVKLGTNGKDHVIVISEWDTFYGRSLPLSFAISVEKGRQAESKLKSNPLFSFLNKIWKLLTNDKRKGKVEKDNYWPDRIHKITYMKGLDGILPNEDGESNLLSVSKSANATQRRKGDSGDMGYYAPDFKQPLGKAQYDYMRRLEYKIDHLKTHVNGDKYDDKRGGKVSAIGIMGSDIYDKLLILRALRPKYPNVIFFTNDLDARLFHHTELPWTRNLIVASSYGLRLHPDLQQDIPSFRDVYQSSVFVATLQATGGLDDNLDFMKLSPRIYEIGRRGPYDITPNLKEDGIYPIRHDRWQWDLKEREFWLYIFLMFILPLLLFGGIVYFIIRGIKDSEYSDKIRQKRMIMWVCSIGYFCIITFTILTFYAFKSAWNGDGEPLSFLDGISIWPALLIQLFCGFLAIFLFLHSVQSLFHNNEEINKMFEKEEKEQVRIKNRSFIKIYDYWKGCCEGEDSSYKYICILGFAFIYLCAGTAFVLLCSDLLIPYRDVISLRAEGCILPFSLFSIIAFDFFVIFSAISYRKFFNKIINYKSHWEFPEIQSTYCSIDSFIGKTCTDNSEDCRNRQEQIITCLSDYDKHLTDHILFHRLIIQVIAKKTKAIGKIIIYPFMVFALLLFSHNKYFDNLNWTPPLIVAIGLIVFITLFFSFRLFFTANIARKKSLVHLTDERFHLMSTQVPAMQVTSDPKFINDEISKLIEQKLKYLDYIIEDIHDMKDGAFAPLAKNPILIAVLAPLGGMGSFAMLQYLPQLVNK